jgi:hypothetical protein
MLLVDDYTRKDMEKRQMLDNILLVQEAIQSNRGEDKREWLSKLTWKILLIELDTTFSLLF